MLFIRYAIAVLAFCFVLPALAETEANKDNQAVEGTATVSPSRLPLQELRAFAEIFERIRASYVEEVDDKTLLENAIHGMLNGLDPHSSYLNADDFEDLRTNTSGKFGGLGIEVGVEDGLIKVVSPIDDTPAQKAGVQAGDLIIKLDDSPVKGLGLNQAIEKMRGEPGTDIVLTILREGENQPLEITLTRAEIKIASIKHKRIENDYGYVRITQFQENTGADLIDAVNKLGLEGDTPLKGYILDLRNNPGGVLDAAVSVSDVFLEQGTIVYTQGRVENADITYEATVDTQVPDTPVVVLINGGSASASEIVAGALQDHKRALVIGTTSFGKGSVQTVLPLDSEHALKLTTARYYTPKGRSIQAQGIEPDIVVQQGEFKAQKESRFYKEVDLQGHLENDTQDDQSTAQANQDDSLQRDYQLSQALTILKGLSFAQSQSTDSDIDTRDPS